MKLKSIVVVSLALSAATLAFAGSTFTITAATTVAGHKVKTGDYEVSVKKDQAEFTDPDGKTFKVPVKIEQSDKKFDSTMVSTNSNGVEGISEIDLGGSKTKLIFGK